MARDASRLASPPPKKKNGGGCELAALKLVELELVALELAVELRLVVELVPAVEL